MKMWVGLDFAKSRNPADNEDAHRFSTMNLEK